MLEVATQFMTDAEAKVKLSFLPKLCDFVSLFSDDDQQQLIQSLIKKCLEEKSTDGQKIKVELLSRLF